MIIWINGAFGAGKTTIAQALQAHLPGSHLFDPEQIGFLLRDLLPASALPADFQDLPLWRALTVKLLAEATTLCPSYLIVPMTLVVPAYFESIIGNLRSKGLPLAHFTLMASKEVLIERLAQRGDGPDAWPARQAERCLTALQDQRFSHHLASENKTPGELVAEILKQIGHP